MSVSTVSEEDARAMVRLVGETAAVAATGSYQKSRDFLLSGLIELVDADAWAWTLRSIRFFISQIKQGGWMKGSGQRWLQR